MEVKGENMNPFNAYLISYTVVLIIAFGLIAFLQRGFFWSWMRVKTSYGRLVLIKVRTLTTEIYRVGEIKEGTLNYTIYKHKRMINNITPDCIYRNISVNCIDVDDEKNAVMRRDYSAVSGFDAIKQADYIERAEKKPVLNDTEQQLKILLIIVIVVGGLVLIGLFFNYQILSRINLIGEMVSKLTTTQALQNVTGYVPIP